MCSPSRCTMTRPGLLALILLSAALLGGVVEAWPSTSRVRRRSNRDGQAQPDVVQPRQWMFTPWLKSSIEATTTITTLTFSGPDQTSVISPTSTGLSGTPSASDSVSLSTGTSASSSESDAGAGLSSSPSTVEAPAATTDAMSTPSTTIAESLSPTESSSSDGSNSGTGNDNRTLAIVLSSTVSVFGLVVLVAIIVFCRRRRRHQRGLPLFKRGVSPIDDDEIERWKSPRTEKAGELGLPTLVGDTDVEADAALRKEMGRRGKPSPQQHTKNLSTSSVKKPPSVIVYNNPTHTTTTVASASAATAAAAAGRYATDAESRRSFHQSHHRYHSNSGSRKTSLDKALPQTPIQARAPNSRAGLTDESVPGDDPFIMPSPSPRRAPSRLSKPPPLSLTSFGSRRGQNYRQHGRTTSSRSSTRSFAGEYYSYFSSGGIAGGAGTGVGGGGSGSEVELSPPRYSHDQVYHQNRHARRESHGTPRSLSAPRTGGGSSHSRVYSSSSIPPRLSFGDDGLGSPGGLWPPPRPRRESNEIGRAIG
ncbi:hypothetical protein VTJ49DRAFT_3327 [Mycothermus thermophilus]|uniref:Uncharacterized protein n=1 Tax=Humicola insolens TaxID=85995 RepID=A0ABR3VMS5_HUMIN